MKQIFASEVNTVVIMASNKKESIERANKEYHRFSPKYVRPYSYTSKGNNFYLFQLSHSPYSNNIN